MYTAKRYRVEMLDRLRGYCNGGRCGYDLRLGTSAGTMDPYNLCNLRTPLKHAGEFLSDTWTPIKD